MNSPGSLTMDDDTPPPLIPTFFRLFGYLSPYKGRVAIILVMMVVYALLLSVLPVLLGNVTDILATSGVGQLALLNTVIIEMFILAILMWFAGIVSQKLLADVSQELLVRLRDDLFSHIQALSLDFFDRRPIGELMSRVTDDTQVIEQFFSVGMMAAVQSVITIIITTIIMVLISPRLALFTYIIISILVIISYILSRFSGSTFSQLQTRIGELNGFAEEWISGEKTVIASRQQKVSRDIFEKISRKASEAGTKAQFSALISQPAATIFFNLQTIILLVLGGFLVVNGIIEIGIIIAFIWLSCNILESITEISSIYNIILNAAVGTGRVFTILDMQPSVADKPGAPALAAVTGDVVFDHVDFSYIPGRRVLTDNSFHAEPGQVFGLCGPTGAGKSTIINILTRYYDIENGKITVDGNDVRSVQQNSLRIQIAQVLQEPFLFSDTIMANLKYAREGATDEDCISAAKQANAHDFIMLQPDGYQTLLAESGTNLSQGQRQMLTIARAIVADPRMLILDEATSNVDTRTEELIQDGLLTLQKNKTSFIIAHRLSTIRNADLILVIDKGAIIERGSHTELMTKKGFYYELYLSQFRGKLAGITAQ